MKKIISILVSVLLCVSMCAVAASAADSTGLDSLVAKLEGFDISALSKEDIGSILGVSDLGTIEQVLGSISTKSPEGDTAAKGDSTAGTASGFDPEAALAGLETFGDSITTESVLEAISGALGGVDLSAITGSVSDGDALSSILGMFEGIDMSSFDMSALTDMISGAFGEGGLDLSSLTAGMDLGSFDITSILGGLGGGDAAGGTTDTLTSIMDALTSGLSGLGLDTSMLSGLADTDIVNFFANLFIGAGGDEGGSTGSSSGIVTTAPNSASSTTSSSVAGTTTPKTGDTSSVFVAMGTIAVASAAAFVCLSKKKEN